MFVRTKGNAFYKVLERQEVIVRNKHIGHAYLVEDNGHRQFTVSAEEVDTAQQADTLEELIQLDDIVFYWQPSDDKEHCTLMSYPREIEAAQSMVIIKLLIPLGENYKCVAKAEPSFAIFGGRRSLIQKGELELI